MNATKNQEEIFIIKRDGQQEPLDINKVQSNDNTRYSRSFN